MSVRMAGNAAPSASRSLPSSHSRRAAGSSGSRQPWGVVPSTAGTGNSAAVGRVGLAVSSRAHTACSAFRNAGSAGRRCARTSSARRSAGASGCLLAVPPMCADTVGLIGAGICTSDARLGQRTECQHKLPVDAMPIYATSSGIAARSYERLRCSISANCQHLPITSTCRSPPSNISHARIRRSRSASSSRRPTLDKPVISANALPVVATRNPYAVSNGTSLCRQPLDPVTSSRVMR